MPATMEPDEYERCPDLMWQYKDIMTKIHTRYDKMFPTVIRELIAIDPDLSNATNGFKIEIVRMKPSFETAV